MDKHIRITYSVAANVITFDYRIRASAAGLFEEEFQAWVPGVTVTIDDQVTEDLPIIPCAELWQ